ncbi:MAG: hypothetical protein AABY76_05500, partial [Planctomycetota bacterium]
LACVTFGEGRLVVAITVIGQHAYICSFLSKRIYDPNAILDNLSMVHIFVHPCPHFCDGSPQWARRTRRKKGRKYIARGNAP